MSAIPDREERGSSIAVRSIISMTCSAKTSRSEPPLLSRCDTFSDSETPQVWVGRHIGFANIGYTCHLRSTRAIEAQQDLQNLEAVTLHYLHRIG